MLFAACAAVTHHILGAQVQPARITAALENEPSASQSSVSKESSKSALFAGLTGAEDPVSASLLGTRPQLVRSQADLLRRIYTTEAPANACVRLLNATGEVGCAGAARLCFAPHTQRFQSNPGLQPNQGHDTCDNPKRVPRSTWQHDASDRCTHQRSLSLT